MVFKRFRPYFLGKMKSRLTLVSMVPLPVQLHTTFGGHQDESNSHQKRQYGLGPLGGPNNGPPAKKVLRIYST